MTDNEQFPDAVCLCCQWSVHFRYNWFSKQDLDLLDQQERASCREGMYVKVIGHLKPFNKQKNIIAFKIRPVEDFNEVTHHLCEVMYTHLAVTRGPPMVSCSGPLMTPDPLTL